MATYYYGEPATPGMGPNGDVTPTLPGNNSANPGFGPIGPVTPSLPGNNGNGNNGTVIPGGISWAWGFLRPIFTTNMGISRVRFYNAAASREPLDIYINRQLAVSDLEYTDYTDFLHILPGTYIITVYSRTNPNQPILTTPVTFMSGNTYTAVILGNVNDYSLQLVNS